jgi:hypothetical protein
MRFDGAWLKGEGAAERTGEFFSHYGVETTLDLNKRGPIHPSLGLGFAMGYVKRDGGGGFFGAGTARAGLDYAMNLDRTDVRMGAGVTGAMVGPRDDSMKDLAGYALFDARVAIGF